MTDAPAPIADELLRDALPFHVLSNALQFYLDLPCYLIHGQALGTWHGLVQGRRKKFPMDFEDFPQWAERIRHNERALERVLREKRPLSATHRGITAVLVPVMKRGRCLAVLHSGPFLKAPPSEQEVVRLWTDLSGRLPSPHDPAFNDYARSLADLPILDARLIEGLQELLQHFAAVLTRSPEGAVAAARMAKLQAEVFAPRLWHRQWVEWQVIQKRFFRFNGDARTLMDWEVAELGIRRFPTTVMAAKRESTGQEWTDRLATLGFQRAARGLAAELGETLVYPLGDYGVLLLSSGDPAGDPALELRVRARDLGDRLSRVCGCKVWVGVGRTDLLGTQLQDSYHEAIAALHVAVSKGQPVVRYDELQAPEPSATALRHRAAELARAVLDAGSPQAAKHRDTFVQQVLIESRGRPELTRRVFLGALQRLLEVLESRQTLEARDLADFEGELTERMETAASLHEMVERFQASMDLVLSFLGRSIEGEKYLRLAKAKDAISASLELPWNLPEAARRYGFSRTVFSREFARSVGMPFSDFLLSQRLVKAKRLLLETQLSMGPIAEACGFSSTNYFLQIFKKKTRFSPGDFRRQAASGEPR